MSEFKRKRLNQFRKLLIKVGKKLIWWRFSKGDKLLLNAAYIGFYNLFNNLIKDKTKVDEQWFLVGANAGINLMNEFFNLIDMMVSKSIEDLVYFVDAAWYLEMGSKPTSIKYIKGNEGIEKLIWTWDNCLMCGNAENLLDKEILKNNQLGALPTGIFKTAFDIILEHVGSSYLVDVEMTQSRSWGDPTCEMTATFTPIEKKEVP